MVVKYECFFVNFIPIKKRIFKVFPETRFLDIYGLEQSMNKKFTVLSVIMAFASVFVWAKKDVSEISVGAKNSWQEKFDINEKKPGKYNIMVTAEDKAGNVAVEGPYNIYIDPESDLPVVGITNPAEGMRVPGNLNIVGTCIDDDTVTGVYLVLDGDEENPVKAEGTEFWSYYLPTTELLEGPHTIEVYGVDDGNPGAYKDADGNVDETKVVPKTGRRAKVMWQLDRRAPVIEVTNKYMGELVSGKMTLAGRVTDGNGIKSLEYSLDGGKYYKDVKLKYSKYKETDKNGNSGEWRFEVPVDTTKFGDGASACWFKATDCAGSIGNFAFLYFIDNTKPDVKIVSPAEGEAANGIFTVAGYAKDIIGLSKLTWQWGSETGEFTLTPGNPYWIKEVNSIGKSKSETFSVTAVDTMGNTVTVKRVIPLDQEADKPVVTVGYPSARTVVEGSDGSLYLRGFVTDDDGPASVTFSVDGGEEHTLDCSGVFYASVPGEFAAGNHTLSLYATDKFGLRGNTVTSTFVSKGSPVSFAQPEYTSSGTKTAFTDGMTVNPEADGTYGIRVSSDCGLSSVSWSVDWGTTGTIPGSLTLAGGEKSAYVSIPLYGDNFPWGVSKITVKATDIYGRESVKNSIVNVLDLTKINTSAPGVYFDDSYVEEDGAVLAGDIPVAGYFAGGTIALVETVPAMRAVSVTNEGNVILVSSAASSKEFSVRVTTDAGAVYESRAMHFYEKPVLPSITLDPSDSYNTERGIPFSFETTDTTLSISGKVTSAGASTLKYRILAVRAEMPSSAGGLVVSSAPVTPTEFTDISLNRRGNFTLDNLGFDTFADGISVVEFVAEDEAGNKTAAAVFVRKIPYAPAEPVVGADGKPVKKDVPRVYWLSGHDYYGVCVYQGTVDSEFKYVRADEVRADAAPMVFTVTPTDLEANKKAPSYSSEPLSVRSESRLSAAISTVDGAAYKNGMTIVLDRNTSAEAGRKAVVQIKSNAAVSNVAYKIEGTETAGGNSLQNGSAAVKTITDGREYQAEIPLANLPAGITKISAVVTDATGAKKTATGTIVILRNHAVLDSEPRVYWTASDGVYFDSERSAYVLKDGASLTGYANVPSEVTASVRGGTAGLEVSCESKLIKLKATADGVYKNVAVRLTGSDGSKYDASSVNIIADSALPSITLAKSFNLNFVGSKFDIEGTVSDANGINSLEYALWDEKPAAVPAEGKSKSSEKTQALEEQTAVPEPVWNSVRVTKSGAFYSEINLDSFEDGYVPVTLRATDGTGRVSYFNGTVFKDTTAPLVSVIIPEAGAVINGENTIAFSVKDNGLVQNIVYRDDNGANKNSFDIYKTPDMVPLKTKQDDEGTEVKYRDENDINVTLNSSMPNARVGTKIMPVGNGMSFVFTDALGNSTSVNKWEFSVDEESDKPRAEIHLPEENQVITTDFTITGVIYDDDGPCKVLFKIDDGEYQTVSEELASSYKINVPLAAMTDNEHTVTVYAVDINGVRGDSVSRKFRISLEEPKGGVTLPEISSTVKETVEIKGWASDKNGISRVQVSVDNGATFNDAKGTTEWSYTFDTRIIQDGTHVVFIKIWDGYGITGLYSSLINIDNTAPSLSLELPLDDSKTTKNIFFSGQTTDNIGLTDLYITVRSLDNKKIPERLSKRNLVPDEIISQALDISELDNGFYNIELTGTDAAGNITRVSRNIQLDKTKPLAKIDLLYPLNGSSHSGMFNIYGTAVSEHEDPVVSIDLYLDGHLVPGLESAQVTPSGYFKFLMKQTFATAGQEVSEQDSSEDGTESAVAEPFVLKDGEHRYQAVAVTKSGKRIISNEQTFIYNSYGPWVTLDTFTYGDFAMNRPLLKGKSGYEVSPEEAALLKDKATPSEVKAAIAAKKVRQVFISFNNGKTYEPVSDVNKGAWQYRVENLDIPAGLHFMLIKAEMYNGENAMTRVVVQVDRTLPSIRLISPGEGGRYNQELKFDGLSSDNIDLKNVNLFLRKGDKASYEVPGFIQGLYFDVSMWGATFYNVGIGLTAFDNAVKVQANFGQFTQEQRDMVSEFLGLEKSYLRFGGNVIGAKIIAQLAYIPFRYFFGRDWDWLSASVSIGANFSYFTDSGASIVTGEKVPQMLSAALMQVEFPRVTIQNWKMFRTWSLYAEPQIWFIPSDIASDDARKYLFTASFGLRTSVF